MASSDKIIKKSDILEKIAKSEREAVALAIKRVNDAIVGATTLPILIDLPTMTPVVYSCLVKQLNESGWRINIGQTIGSISSIE